jgi:transposase
MLTSTCSYLNSSQTRVCLTNQPRCVTLVASRDETGGEMVGRGELTDLAWSSIEPLLPACGARGGQWRDHRTVINGILWKLRTGAPWRDLPERYGPWQTCADRLSIAGDATAPGIGCLPMCRPDRMRWARWSGRSASIVPPPAPITMRVAPVVGAVEPMKKRDLPPERRGTRTQPWRANDQVSSRL